MYKKLSAHVLFYSIKSFNYKDFIYSKVATFQMALVPSQDEKSTFCIFAYLPGMQNWMKTVDHAEVSIGISDGRKFYKQNKHSFSLSALELHHIVGNTGMYN